MNTRFAVATHILIFLELHEGRPTPSEFIAGSVNTNPSLIRRLLSQLARAGLTTSQFGAGGGALLARPAERITLLDVYRAMDEEGVVFGIHEEPSPACMVGRNIQDVLGTRLDEAHKALLDRLARTTIADLARDVARSEARRPRVAVT